MCEIRKGLIPFHPSHVSAVAAHLDFQAPGSSDAVDDSFVVEELYDIGVKIDDTLSQERGALRVPSLSKTVRDPFGSAGYELLYQLPFFATEEQHPMPPLKQRFKNRSLRSVTDIIAIIADDNNVHEA
jgi:hypothetical protein